MPGKGSLVVALADNHGIESMPGHDTGTAVPGIITAGIASGAGGAVITAPGADAPGISGPWLDRGIAAAPSKIGGKPPSIPPINGGSSLMPGKGSVAIAPADNHGIESVPGRDSGTVVPGIITVAAASGTGGAVTAAPGADAAAIGAFACDIGTVAPGAVAAGIASGAGGEVITAPGADALGNGASGRDIGMVAPGASTAGIASGTGGVVIDAAGADALGIGAPGWDIGTVVPGIIAPGIASGTGGDMMAASGLGAPRIALKTLEAMRSIAPGSIPANIPIALAAGTDDPASFAEASRASGGAPPTRWSLVVMIVAYFHPFEYPQCVFSQDRRGKIQRDQVRCCRIIVDPHEPH
jgi:hypothetical protein